MPNFANHFAIVFLRVLEYYSGILFLTTNRVGALDEAFRSRVHVSLYYPHLSYTDTEAILCNNLKRLPRADALPEDETPGSDYIQVMDREIIDFIKDEYTKHYQTHRRGPWNGRQIRNAVQIASCIAFHDQKGGRKNLPAVLTREHFKTVHETMTEFDGYMAKAQRVDQAKMAHMEGVRYDLYGEDGGDQEPVEYEGFGGHTSEPQFGSKYPAGRGGMSTSSRSLPAPRPARPQAGPSGGRFSPVAPPATYRSRGQATHHVASRAYDEQHFEEHATFQKNPQVGRLSVNDPYARGHRPVPRQNMQIDHQEDLYHDNSEHLSEWADDNDHLSVDDDEPQTFDEPGANYPTQSLRDQSLDEQNLPIRSVAGARAHRVHEKQARYRQAVPQVP